MHWALKSITSPYFALFGAVGNGQQHAMSSPKAFRVHVRWTPHPVIVTIKDNGDSIMVLFYSYYTTITGRAFHLRFKVLVQGLGLGFRVLGFGFRVQGAKPIVPVRFLPHAHELDPQLRHVSWVPLLPAKLPPLSSPLITLS